MISLTVNTGKNFALSYKKSYNLPMQNAGNGKELEGSQHTPVVASQPRMESPIARLILEQAVSIHELIFTPDTRIGEYSTQQIREAIMVVFEDLTGSHPGNVDTTPGYFPGSKLMTNINRTVPAGVANLFVSYLIDEKDAPKYICLAYLKDPGLEMTFPLIDEDHTEIGKRFSIRFRDYRPDTMRDVFLGGWNGANTLEELQFLWRGSRWLFANMLDWDRSDLILPEQLDHLYIS